MKDIRINVKSYSGYRGEETPRSFVIYEEDIVVIDILNIWIAEDPANRTRRRFFKLKGDDSY
ncbi:MAG: hypothetical protein AB1632_01425 [Nitrospirota bacterium]